MTWQRCFGSNKQLCVDDVDASKYDFTWVDRKPITSGA